MNTTDAKIKIDDVLRVYFVFCSSIEAKLNCLAFEHSGKRFQADALPFLLNLTTRYDQDNLSQKKHTFELFRYIHYIHNQYFEVLKNEKLVPKSAYFPALPENIKFPTSLI